MCFGWEADFSPESRTGLTPLISPTYFVLVIRFVIAVLCALGLALSPAAANGAIAAPAATTNCTMGGHMPVKPVDHSKMDCCTPACPMAAPALLPERVADAAVRNSKIGLHDIGPVKELASFTASGLDPPPRLPS